MSSVPSGPAQDRPGSPDGLRTGAQYLADIGNDGRQVIYDGEIVRDVTTHPAFSGAARSIAGLWDIAADPANRELMTYPSPRTGKPVLWCYHIPQRPEFSAPRDHPPDELAFHAYVSLRPCQVPVPGRQRGSGS